MIIYIFLFSQQSMIIDYFFKVFTETKITHYALRILPRRMLKTFGSHIDFMSHQTALNRSCDLFCMILKSIMSTRNGKIISWWQHKCFVWLGKHLTTVNILLVVWIAYKCNLCNGAVLLFHYMDFQFVGLFLSCLLIISLKSAIGFYPVRVELYFRISNIFCGKKDTAFAQFCDEKCIKKTFVDYAEANSFQKKLLPVYKSEEIKSHSVYYTL